MSEMKKPPANMPILRPMGRGRPPHETMGMAPEKASDVKGTLKRLIKYIGKSKFLLLSLIGVMLAATLLGLAAPILQANAIDCFKLENEIIKVDFSSLVILLIVLGAVYGLHSLATYFQGLFAARLSQTTVKIMRRDLFEKITALPLKYIDSHPHGDLMSRMTNDIENISNTVSQSIASLFSGIITISGCIIIMLYYSPLLTLVVMSVMLLTVFVTKTLSKLMRKYFPLQASILGKMNSHIEEMTTGHRTVAAFGREAAVSKAFDEISEEYKKTAIKAQIFGGVMGPCMNVIHNISFLLVAAVGGIMTFTAFNPLALAGAMTVGVIQAFITYSKQFSRPISEIAQQYSAIQNAIAGAERVFEVMDTESETDLGTATLVPEKVKGDINFKDIDFSYVKGEKVLKSLNLWVKSGQKIAIVGATGSGKTTVVNLLTRFYETDGGTITLDGIDICSYPKNELRSNIGIVLQDTVIFSDTIARNIRYGKLTATDAEVEAAAKTARVADFAENLTDRYETVLSEGGSNLSQGQRQLISIARAVLSDPKILILDEATSSIDTRTEMHIQAAMLNLMRGRTSIIIAHRLSTIRDADKIVVIDGGKVVEAGSHTELLEQGGCYALLYQKQFAGIAT